MIITHFDGEKQTVQAGSSLNGMRLRAVEISADDMKDVRFASWLLNDVLTRLVPKEIGQ